MVQSLKQTGIRFLAPEVLARIDSLELVARTVVEGFISGLHRSPHLGFSTKEVFKDFYQGAIDNIVAFLDGKPTRLVNPDVLKQ